MKQITARSGILNRHARHILNAALAAADAENAVRRHLRLTKKVLHVAKARFDLRTFDRVFVISAGKAALPMASAIEDILGAALDGIFVITKHGHATGVRPQKAQVWEAGHPVPDVHGMEAALALESLLRELNARDLLIVALSGGASALLPSPVASISLKAKQAVTNQLLRAGADIAEINCVRKHLSRLKGGGLAALAYPATVIGLLLSDVIGDRADVIGSGPTAPDASTFQDALAVLAKFNLSGRVPRPVRRYLELGAAGQSPETPKPNDPIFRHVQNFVIGSGRLALEAAARKARELGYRTLILSSTIDGETRDAAAMHAEILREVVTSGNPVKAPACILSAGETTVALKGHGKGGRNQEFALAAALKLAGLRDVLLLSAGTDGTDGPTDAAGAVADGSTVARALERGLDPHDHLARNDSYPLFDALGDLIRTGPTGTNVMDIHIMLAR